MTRYVAGDYLHDTDINILHDMVSGCNKIDGFSMSLSPTTLYITVSSGSGVSGGTKYDILTSTALPLTADSTYPRKAVVYLNTAGDLICEHGFPSETIPYGAIGKATKQPMVPTISSGSLLLAEIFIPANVTSASGCEIFEFETTARPAQSLHGAWE